MSEKERKIIGMKYPNIVPAGYRCDNCGSHGVKLWCGDIMYGLHLEQVNCILSSVPKLLCAHCAEEDQKKIMHDGWKSDYLLKLNDSREIGCLFPALPMENYNLFYSNYSVPSYAIMWWDKLPALIKDEFIGFEVLEDLIFEKEIIHREPNKSLVRIKLSVTISPGVILVNSPDNRLCFRPHGIVSPEEKINISEERLNYLSERDMIKLLPCL